MSYNITTWKTLNISDFSIPLASLYAAEDKQNNAHGPVVMDIDTMAVIISLGEGTIVGVLKDKRLHISKINFHGEGSGTIYHELLEPALKQSTGEMEVHLIWEGGDTIETLKINNGVITTIKL